MQETGKIEILGGNPERLGAYRIHGGYNFAVSVPGGVPAELLLYRGNSQKPEKIIPLPEKERTGQISAVCVKGLEPGVWEYSYRMGESRGADPYARILRKEPGKKSRQGEYRGVLAAPAAARLPALDIPYEDCLFYKTHVRGFTMRAGIEQKYRGTFRGVREMIPYLKELGVTSLLLMPVYEFEEFPPEQDRREKTRDQVLREQVEHPYALPEEEKPRKVQKNYWGYTGGLYFAPKASYSSSGCPSGEFAEMMDALHEAGIECILEFYFLPDMPSRTVLDILHYWRLNFQADGFHLLGEGSWIDAVTEDPLLKKTKLIYLSYGEERLARNGRQQICRNLAEMNMGYEELMRRFLKGDPGCTEGAAWFLRRNSQDCAYINYFADQDGFTMMDMVSCLVPGQRDRLAELEQDEGSHPVPGICGTGRGVPPGAPGAAAEAAPCGLMDYQACGFPDLSYHGGARLVICPWRRGIPSLGVLLWGTLLQPPGRRRGDSPIYILYNMYWQDRKFCPAGSPGGNALVHPGGFRQGGGGSIPRRKRNRRSAERIRKILVPARTVMILTGKQE